MLVTVLIGYGCYWLGGYLRVPEYGGLKLRHTETNAQLAHWRSRADELEAEAASLRQGHELDLQANKNITLQLNRLRGELTETREELELYSRLVNQSADRSGVAVHSLVLASTAMAGEYRYDLVVAQSLTAKESATGEVEIVMVGPHGTALVGEHDFEFKVFEKFSGVMLGVPQVGSDADNPGVKVRVVVHSKGQQSVHEFSWPELWVGEQVVEQSNEESE
jgi:hypothetical protein